MKVNNWRKNLATTLAACGLLSPAAYAANLNTNLVVNPSFENVDTNVVGDFGAVKILDWSGINGFAYSHFRAPVDYADGADPAGAGTYYFSANNNPGSATGDIRQPNLFYQDIDVSTGATGTAIAAGKGKVNLSAWMSSYKNDNDYGIARVEYLNAAGQSLGFTEVKDLDPGPNNVWSQTTGAAPITVGAAKLRVSLYGQAVEGGSDGYIDLLDVQVSQTPNAQFLFLEVNTTTGLTTLKNEIGVPVQMDYYEIVSAGGSLKSNTWNSLQDQNLAGLPAGNGSGNGWEEAGGSGTGILSEGFLSGSSSVATNASISLGSAFNTAGAQDLVFNYSVVSQASLSADFDSDGDADGADFLAWQRGFGTNTGATKAQGDANADGAVNAADLTLWKSQFGSSAFGGPGVLTRGFVKYVSAAATAVPEPSSCLLAGMGIGLAALARTRRSEK